MLIYLVTPDTLYFMEDADIALAKLIGENVKAVRTAAGLTQAQLRDATEIAVPHLSRLESGAHLPGLATLRAVAEALGVTVCDLISPPKPTRPKRR